MIFTQSYIYSPTDWLLPDTLREGEGFDYGASLTGDPKLVRLHPPEQMNLLYRGKYFSEQIKICNDAVEEFFNGAFLEFQADQKIYAPLYSGDPCTLSLELNLIREKVDVYLDSALELCKSLLGLCELAYKELRALFKGDNVINDSSASLQGYMACDERAPFIWSSYTPSPRVQKVFLPALFAVADKTLNKVCTDPRYNMTNEIQNGGMFVSGDTAPLPMFCPLPDLIAGCGSFLDLCYAIAYRERGRFNNEQLSSNLKPLLRRNKSTVLIPSIPPVLPTAEASDKNIGRVHTMPNESTEKRVFIAYGHDQEQREILQGMLLAAGLDPFIVEFEFKNGHYLLDDVLEGLKHSVFGIALLTGDDIALETDGGRQEHRARQNVVLELGMMLAQLGLEHTAILVKGDTKIMSDIEGPKRIPFKNSIKEVTVDILTAIQDGGIAIEQGKFGRTTLQFKPEV
ncbi:MAG: nucleotide-binding protein [Succinivibrio sp.]|nr:nucleotide-binding protein [Succinivibrio sp.]